MIGKTVFKYIVVLLSGMMLVACESKEERLERQLSETIRQYLAENLPSEMQVDSLQFLHVDSLTEYQYLLYVERPIAENHLEELHEAYSTYPDDGDVSLLEKKQQIGDEITAIINRLDRFEDRLVNNLADTTRLKCYFVSVKVYMKQENQVLEPEYYGFPITPDFEVLETEAIPY